MTSPVRRCCAPSSSMTAIPSAGRLPQNASPVAVAQARHDLVGEAVGIARQRLGRDDAHELPVARWSSPCRARAGAGARGAPGAARAARRRAAGSGRARARRAPAAPARPRPRRRGRACRRPRRRRRRRRAARPRRRRRGRRRRRAGSSAGARVAQAQRPQERRDHLAPHARGLRRLDDGVDHELGAEGVDVDGAHPALLPGDRSRCRAPRPPGWPSTRVRRRPRRARRSGPGPACAASRSGWPGAGPRGVRGSGCVRG